MTSDCAVTADAVVVPAECTGTVDVLFGSHRVWSFHPDRDGTRTGSRLRVPWPKVLRNHLAGTGTVVLREHVSGRVLFEEQVRLGDSDRPLQVFNKAGQPLTVDKTGRLQRMFTERRADAVADLLDGVDHLLTVLREQGEVEAFLAFGCLLGAVRGGRLIGHDCDADVGYVSRRTHPLDVTLESFELERAVRRAGFETNRMSSGDFKVVRTAAGVATGIDVFGGFYADGIFHLMPNVRGELPVSSILPTSSVTLEGRALPAPADPSALLELTYGASWRVPDPAFHYAPPRSTRRRLGGWMRGENTHRREWGEFYGGGADGVPRDPSGFAGWVLASGRLADQVVDVGCGTGRDALALRSVAGTVVGLDYANTAVSSARRRATKARLDVEFAQMNLYETRETLTTGARLAHRLAGRPADVYARLLLSALNDAGRANFWRFARMLLPLGGRLYLEFRTPQDRRRPHEYAEHWHRFLDPQRVIDEAAVIGARVEERREGTGLAVLRGEDPHVCQLVLKGQ